MNTSSDEPSANKPPKMVRVVSPLATASSDRVVDKLALTPEDLREVSWLWKESRRKYGFEGGHGHDYQEAIEAELLAYLKKLEEGEPVAHLLQSLKCLLTLKLLPWFFLIKGMKNYAGPGTKYTHPGGEEYMGSALFLSEGPFRSLKDLKQRRCFLRAGGLDYVNHLKHYTLRSLSVTIELSPGNWLGLPMNVDYAPGFYDMRTIYTHDNHRSLARDEIFGKYQGEAVTRQLDRNQLKFWHDTPSLMPSAFMHCACESFKNFAFYTKFPVVVDGRVCYFRLRHETNMLSTTGAPRQDFAGRRMRFSEKGGLGEGCLVFGQSERPSKVGLAEQKWILEAESKRMEEINNIEHVPTLLRNWGWVPVAEIDVLRKCKPEECDQDYSFGLGCDTPVPYINSYDTHFCSNVRFVVYKYSKAGRALAEVLKLSDIWMGIAAVMVHAAAWYWGWRREIFPIPLVPQLLLNVYVVAIITPTFNRKGLFTAAYTKANIGVHVLSSVVLLFQHVQMVYFRVSGSDSSGLVKNITFFMSLIHVVTIMDMSQATSGSLPFNVVMHYYTCTAYVRSLWQFALEDSYLNYGLVLGSYSGFANTRLIVILFTHLPLRVIQVLFIFLLGFMNQRFNVLEASLTAYLVGIAIPAEKKAHKPTKNSFDIAHILAVRLVFSHHSLGVVRDVLPVLISLTLLVQKLMDAGLMRKVHVPSISRAIDACVLSYQRNAVPIVKRFRGLASGMREKLVMSVPLRMKPPISPRLQRLGSRIPSEEGKVNMSCIKKTSAMNHRVRTTPN